MGRSSSRVWGCIVVMVMAVRIVGGDMVLIQVWQWWRGLRLGRGRATETAFELVAQRTQRVAGCAVGGRLGREDEGIWLGAASLIARADDGPATESV